MQPPPAPRPDAKTLQAAAADAGITLPDAAIQAFQQGRMIEAIKLVRASNPGLNLARAKAAMEHLQRAQGSGVGAAAGKLGEAHRPAPLQARATRPPTVEQGDPPGQLRWLLIVLALVAGGVWFAFGGMPS